MEGPIIGVEKIIAELCEERELIREKIQVMAEIKIDIQDKIDKLGEDCWNIENRIDSLVDCLEQMKRAE